MKNIKTHFVFDLDDTLIDGHQFYGEAIVRSITKLDSSVNKEAVFNLYVALKGLAIFDTYKKIVEELKLNLDIDLLLKIDYQIQAEEMHKMVKCFDGVIEILEFLKSKQKNLHILTNRKEETLIPILEHIKIKHYFKSITSCIDKGFKKPDPHCFNDLVNQFGNNKDEFIYFGDSEVDSNFAKNAQVESIIFDQYLNNKNLFKKLINIFID